MVTTPAEVRKDLVDALGHDHRFALLLVRTPAEVKWIAVPINPASASKREAQGVETPCSNQPFLSTCNSY